MSSMFRRCDQVASQAPFPRCRPAVPGGWLPDGQAGPTPPRRHAEAFTVNGRFPDQLAAGTAVVQHDLAGNWISYRKAGGWMSLHWFRGGADRSACGLVRRNSGPPYAGAEEYCLRCRRQVVAPHADAAGQQRR